MYLIYYVDKGLGIVTVEATDRVTFIRTREDRLNHRRKVIRSEQALDQTLADWSVEVEKEE